MKVRLIFDKHVLNATLDDSKAAKSFFALLPLELQLEDYAATEKISDLPQKLAVEDAPRGYQPKIGDITYYAPWGNLAIFYKNFGYANGLVRLGEITSDIKLLKKSGSFTVRIESDE